MLYGNSSNTSAWDLPDMYILALRRCTLGHRVYISGKSLVLMVQLLIAMEIITVSHWTFEDQLACLSG